MKGTTIGKGVSWHSVLSENIINASIALIRQVSFLFGKATRVISLCINEPVFKN